MSEDGASGTAPARRGSDRQHLTGVLFVSPLPPPPGGIAVWTATLMQRGLPPPFKGYVVDTGLVGRTVADPLRLSVGEFRRSLRILWQTYRQIRSKRPAIVHINSSLSRSGVLRDWLCARIARVLRVPYVVHLRGNFLMPGRLGPRSRLLRWVYHNMLGGASAIIALNTRSYEAVLELGGWEAKTCILPNFVDCRSMPERQVPGDGRRPLMVIYVGALSRPKGLYTILDVAQRIDGVTFQLVGAPERDAGQELRSVIQERGLEDRVRLMGSLPNAEVRTLLADSDVYLFPSVSEGFPISVAEAMAAGLPVVASPAGAIPDMIDAPRGGFVISWDDVQGYVEALERLRDDTELARAMGRYNRDKASSEYDYDIVVRRLCNVYSQILWAQPFDAAAAGVGG